MHVQTRERTAQERGETGGVARAASPGECLMHWNEKIPHTLPPLDFSMMRPRTISTLIWINAQQDYRVAVGGCGNRPTCRLTEQRGCSERRQRQRAIGPNHMALPSR